MREAEVFRSSTGALVTIRWDTLTEKRSPEENRQLNEVVRRIQINAARRALEEKQKQD